MDGWRKKIEKGICSNIYSFQLLVCLSMLYFSELRHDTRTEQMKQMYSCIH